MHNELIPDLGGAENVDVIEVCVAAGDTVAIDDPIIVLETDKASLEVPATVAGVISELKIKVGDKVNEGDLLALIQGDGGDAPAAEAAPVVETTAAPVAEPAAAPVVETAPAVASEQAFKVPDLGGSEQVEVIEVIANAGDSLSEGDPIIVLETDKASLEVPAETDGTVVSVAVKVGDKVSEGDDLIVMTVSGGAAAAPVSAPAASAAPASAPAPAPAPASAAPAASPVPASSGKPAGKGGHAGPAVRKLARELGVELDLVAPTGRKNRITKDDLHAYIKSAVEAKQSGKSGGGTGGDWAFGIPDQDFTKFGEIERVATTKIDKLTSENMHRSWVNIPHVTQFDEADVTELEAFRKSIKAEAEKAGVRVTPVAFIIKAVAVCLQRHPKFNSSLTSDGSERIFKKYVNIGMAVDTPRGLLVPVIKDADKKTVYEIANDVIELAGLAKDGKLKPNQMQGGCFTVSSLGAIGGQGFTPIVNPPEVGILGVSKSSVKPIWNGSEFAPRTMLPLCLSYDHRAINGGDAGRFLTELAGLLTDIRKMMM